MKTLTRNLFFVFLLTLFAQIGFGQVQIYVVDFESAGGYLTNTSECSDGSGDYFERTDGSDIGGIYNTPIGTYFFAAQDVDAAGCPAATLPATLLIDDINISSYSSLELRVYLAEDDASDAKEDWDAADYVHFDYDIDNSGSFSDLLWIESSGTTNTAPLIDTDYDGIGDGTEITSTFVQFTQSIAGTGSLIDIQIDFNLNSGDEDIAIDHIEIWGTAAGGPEVDWCNLQWPTSGNIRNGDVFNAYARVYEAGVTEGAGQGANITAWMGYSLTDSDPSTASWTWVPATYNGDNGNNDEYTAEIGSGLAAGTYYYASRFQLSGGPYKYGGYNAGGGGFWDGTSNVSNVLTVDVVDWCNIQSPENGTVALGASFDVYAQILEDTETNPAGQAANITSWIGYSTVDNDPTDGANAADWTWVPASYNTDVGNNDEYSLDLENAIGAGGTYYYVSRFQIGSGPYAYGGYNGGFWENEYSVGSGNKSGQLIITAPTITTSVASLTGFTYVEGSGPSAEQSYTVEGVNLTNDITVTPPANWEVSLVSGGPYQTTPITLTHTGGTVSTTTIYTIMSSGLTNAGSPYSGNIANTSTDATTQNVAVDGTVTIPLPNAWINEFHYDNNSVDENEGIEIVIENPGSYTLSDFQVNIYNGSGGASYGSETLDNFVVGNIAGTATIYTWAVLMQNGAPDGLALSYNGTLIQFLSYEGSFSATDGPANGVSSTDIGVSETNSTSVGHSLQLSGSGCSYSDFIWQSPAANTMGAENNSQTICGGSGPTIDITGTDPTSDDFEQNSSDNILYQIEVAVAGGTDQDVSQIQFDAVSTAANLDALVSGYTLYYSTDATLDGGDSNLGTVASTTTTNQVGILYDFSATPITISSGNTGYFFITTYVLLTANVGSTVQATNVDATYTTAGGATDTETYAAGNAHTIVILKNTESDIIVNSAFDEPDNIDYTSHLEANLTSTSLEVAQFTIRDGGAANDADGEVTELTDIIFSVSNSANLQRIAIYDGATEIQEVAAGATVTFNGISLSAADNSSKDFSIRASFNSTVTDNQQFQFTVTSATANPVTSTFAAADAGGAYSSIAGDDNRIDVIAKNLFFDNQPSNTPINETMAAVTVIAVDDNLNIDLDYTGNVQIVSTGTMTGDPITVAAGSGTVTFSNIVHTVTGTGYTLTATATGLLSDLSSTFNITEFVYAAGDYRSTSDNISLSWNNNTGATNNWEYFDGSSWGPTPNDDAPQNASTTPSRVIIKNIGVDGGGNTSNSYNDIIILHGGELILNDWAYEPLAVFILADKSLEVQSGGALEIQGNFDMTSTSNFIVRSGGTMIINSPNMRNDDEMWNGSENFEVGSTVQIDDWDWNATSATVRSIMNVTTAIDDNSNGYKFGNITINIPTTISQDFTIVGGGIVANLCANDFTINNLSDYYVGLASNKSTGTQVNIGGNLIVNSGNFNFGTSFSADAFDQTITVFGDFEYNGSKSIYTHRNNITATEITSSINFKGNFYVASTATLFDNQTATNGDHMPINFNGTNPQNIDIRININHNAMFVKSGATANLVYDMDLTGTNSVLTVDNGGVWQIMPSINMTAPSGSIVQNAGSTGFVIKSDATGTGSLIQQNIFAATCERYLTGGDWNFIFSPLSTADGSVLMANGEEGYSYNETIADYWDATTIYGDNGTLGGWNSGIDNPMSITKGYIHKGASPNTYDFSGGNLEVTDKTFTLSYTNSGSGVPVGGEVTSDWDEFEGWNLFGNPYASAIDWDYASGWDRSKIESFVYYYDGSGYKFYGSGTSYSQGISSAGGSQFIPANQGFFVKALDTGHGLDFTIPADARVHNSQAFWKGNKEIDPNIIRMTISKGTFTDEMIVRTLVNESEVTEYHDGAYDAYKMFSFDNSKPQLYSLTDDKTNFFAVNSLPEFTGHKVVSLGVYIGEAGDYSINMTENSFENTHIWLEDAVLNTNTNLLTQSSYLFNQTAEQNNDRFFLHFEKNHAPKLTETIPDQVIPVNEAYEYYLPENMFTDTDFEDALTISAELENGNALPDWLNFNAETGVFSGIPAEVQSLNIKVTATDMFGESVSDMYKLTVNSGSSINNISEKSIYIYPNPTKDVIHIEFLGNISEGEIILKDITGKIIHSEKIFSKNNKLYMSNLSKGIYMLEIRMANQSINKKIIKD